MKHVSTLTLTGGAKWPLTGGVPSHLSFTEGKRVERIYIAGYQDGSVRIWDATYPVLSLICVLEGEVRVPKVPSLIVLKFNKWGMSFSDQTFWCPNLSHMIGRYKV